jgi:ADP-heptose:LPS heptosyltransferase
MERLLCVKIASRGDLLLAAPAFKFLREFRPNDAVDLLVGDSCHDVAQHLPFFERVHVLDDKRLMAGNPFEQAFESLEMVQRFREYSAVYLFHRDWRYAWLAWLARVPKRHGLSRQGEGGFLTHACRPPEDEHHTLQYLRLVGCGPGMDPEISLAGMWRSFPSDEASFHARFPDLGLGCGQKRIALAFGGGVNVKTQTGLKRWGLDSFKQLARRLSAEGMEVCWVGDREDAKLLDNSVVGLNLSGELSLSELAMLLKRCSRVVANDSLILHLAESVGVPTIGLFGPTDPAHYRPMGASSSYFWKGEALKCAPCHRDGWYPDCAFDHRCMKLLTVDEVFQGVLS